MPEVRRRWGLARAFEAPGRAAPNRRGWSGVLAAVLVLAPVPLVPLLAAPAAHAAQACPADAGYTDCLSFAYTGSDQDFTVPTGVSSIRAKAWGAGAAADGDTAAAGREHANRPGAAGAYATALLEVTAGQRLTVVPGQGGRSHPDAADSPAARNGGASTIRSGQSHTPADTLLAADGGTATNATETATASGAGAAGAGPAGAGAAGAGPEDGSQGLAPHVTERQYVTGAAFGGFAPSITDVNGANTGADAAKGGGHSGDGGNGLVVLEWKDSGADATTAKADPSAASTPTGQSSAPGAPSPEATPSAAAGPAAPSSAAAAPSAAPLGRLPRAPGDPLDCTGNTIYAIQRGSSTAATGTLLALAAGTVGGSSVTATTVSTLPAGSGFTNALGITDGGTAAYVVDQTPTVAGSVNVYGYNAATGAWTTYTGSAGATTDSFVAGAVNPANGIYYYASFEPGTATTPGVATLYGFNTVTNTAIPGVIATFDLPVTGASGPNGDITFDAAGNLYVLSSVGTDAAIGRVAGPIPTTGSATGVPLTDTVLSTLPNPNGNSFNGAAFDNAGNLYIEFASGSTTYLEQLNPNTGAITAGPTPYSNNAFLSVDLGACSTNPTLALQKNIVGRFAESTTSNDQFGLAITGGGITQGNTATTTGTSTGVQTPPAGPVIAVSGTTYTLTETAASGSLANYTTAYDCVDTANGNAPVASGTGATTFNLPFPPTVEGKNSPMVLCTFTNTPVPATPSLTIVKTASPTTVTAVGQVVDYSFLVTNTGNVTLTDVTVNETAFSGTGTPPVITCPAGAASLAPGASVTCTAPYTVTQADINAGSITNTATATGTPPTGPPVTSPPSSATVTATPAPALTIMKTASPTTVSTVGQVVNYSFLVTNTGNVTLTDVTVNETAFSGTGTPPVVTCPAGAASLAPGASVTCTASYAVTQADINAGSITNTATATGTPPTGPPVTSPPSSATVTATSNPALTILKSVDATELTGAGQVLHYSFLVTNTGNVTLTNVTVNETAFSGTGTPPVITCPAGAASLAPGASVTCTASYTVTQADVDSGKVTNTATATGTPPTGPPVTSPPSSTSVPNTPAPALTIVKSASPTTVSAVGQVVDYSFLVTNTGNVTLTNVTVNETAFSGTGTPPVITCPAGAASLAPGASVTCTATYTVTQADLNAGSITDTATATGTPPTGPPVTSPPSSATVTATSNPALTIVKSVDATELTAVGQVLHYSFLVTNTGNVTLTNVTVNETAFSGSGTAPVVTCPAGAASLAPGASVTCTATYTVTQADLNGGKVANTATATGTPPTGPPATSPPSSTNVPNTPAPALTVVKSASPTTVTAAGQTVDYSFLVTNTGNVTLTDVTVNETAFSGSGTAPVVTCPAGAASLAPGASVTCTATYTVTQADLNSGKITNTSTATGTPPSGPPATSPPSSATVTAKPPHGHLPSTGANTHLAGLAGSLLLLGGGLALVTRRTRRRG
ncbi:LPXTG cell wall anchor domain-containing protein [Kitasatospora sp. NPDC091276]|uniref:beta strand repeat-containing protein n=1 Tax=Kitasatospora sp. NPDC091276 TaxID=3155300 RepID=UPI003433B9DD